MQINVKSPDHLFPEFVIVVHLVTVVMQKIYSIQKFPTEYVLAFPATITLSFLFSQ